MKFRRILENSGLGKAMFESIVRDLESAGQLMRGGSIVDATIINAPSSTKNEKKERDPEMKQTMKGKEWKFGMKIHIGGAQQGGVSVPVHESAVRIPQSGLQGHCQEPEPRICSAGQFQPVCLCQSWPEFAALDGIGLPKRRKNC